MTSSARSTQLILLWSIIFFLLYLDFDTLFVSGFSLETKSKSRESLSKKTTTRTTKFSVPLLRPKPKAENFSDKFWSLWNDKRSIENLIRDEREEDNDGNNDATPYCIVSDEFEVCSADGEKFRFQVMLYPRGVFSVERDDSSMLPGSAYLKFVPSTYGDEVDISWKMRLVDSTTGNSLPIQSSGGLPKSNDTWSTAMTFCTRNEAVDSVGRTMDWGSSNWNSRQICECLSNIKAEGEITVHGSGRKGESSFALKGALRDSLKAATTPSGEDRIFRAGEVLVSVPSSSKSSNDNEEELRKLGIFPGVDYRIMTMTDQDGNEIFSTASLKTKSERKAARLALRPVGLKRQEVLAKSGLRQQREWPTEVRADLLAPTALSRFHRSATISRFKSFFVNDVKSVLVALALAVSPIPAALVAREIVSLYAIPSASMDPTLQKGDVLLVEKLPNVYDRVHRGDIILFRPTFALEEIVRNTGGESLQNQLFVKRLVGLPGDTNIMMQEDTQEVKIQNQNVAGPSSRSLCQDEPLRLIDKLLNRYGYGKYIDELKGDETYVLGDCKDVSVDSRVFGTVPIKNIVGRPIARVWPLQRFMIGSPP